MEFLDLSDEIIVHILSFLNSSGGCLLNISQTCKRLKRLARDKNIVKNLSLRNDFDVRAEVLKEFFSGSCDEVKQLNLNGLYWIKPSVICSLVLKMPNLTHLHVGDILFTAKQFHSILTKLSSLKVLSFTWHWYKNSDLDVIADEKLTEVYQRLSSLTLYIATGAHYSQMPIAKMLCKCSSLKHLVILSENIDGTTEQGYEHSHKIWEIAGTFPSMPKDNIQEVLLHVMNRNIPALNQWIDGEFRLENKDHKGYRIFDGYAEEVKKELEETILEDMKSVKFLFSMFKRSPFDEQEELASKILDADPKSFDACSSLIIEDHNHNLNDFNFFKKMDELNLVNRFENLKSISLPSCCYLDKDINYQISSKSFEKMFQQMNISHLEIQGCCQGEAHTRRDSSNVLDCLKSNKLESLKLSEVKILQSASLKKLFQRLKFLTSLNLVYIRCSSDFNLISDLSIGLADASNLKFLQMIQPGVTDFTHRLLESVGYWFLLEAFFLP